MNDLALEQKRNLKLPHGTRVWRLLAAIGSNQQRQSNVRDCLLYKPLHTAVPHSNNVASILSSDIHIVEFWCQQRWILLLVWSSATSRMMPTDETLNHTLADMNGKPGVPRVISPITTTIWPLFLPLLLLLCVEHHESFLIVLKLTLILASAFARIPICDIVPLLNYSSSRPLLQPQVLTYSLRRSREGAANRVRIHHVAPFIGTLATAAAIESLLSCTCWTWSP